MKSATYRWSLQPKFLRVLQEQEFERLGSNRTLHVDVRVVAATNGDLAQLVEEKKFRSDLYYRLNVFRSSSSIARTARGCAVCWCAILCRRFSRRQNKTVEYVPSDVMEALVNYSWPGNVRELENLDRTSSSALTWKRVARAHRRIKGALSHASTPSFAPSGSPTFPTAAP